MGKPIVQAVELAAHNLGEGGAGAYRENVGVGGVQQMFRLGPRDDEFVTSPAPVLITMGYQMTNTTWTGSFDVIAQIVFAAGLCNQTLECDVPAGGTAISVPAPDGLELRMRAEGTSANGFAHFRASIAYLRNSHPRAAYRSLLWTMPADTTVIRAIPRFARGFWLMSNVPASLPPTVVAVLENLAAGAGRVLSHVVPAEGTYYALPLGAEAMRMTSAAVHDVRAVFELAP